MELPMDALEKLVTICVTKFFEEFASGSLA
jgi:hypothetical protein